MPDHVFRPVDEGTLQCLPRPALIMFAVRCAERVMPLFKHEWAIADDGYAESLQDAVKLATQAAIDGQGPGSRKLEDAAEAALAIYKAAQAAKAYGASHIAMASSLAARAASRATAKWDDHTHDDTTTYAAEAATAAAMASNELAFDAIRSDFVQLRHLAEQLNWKHNSSVDTTLLGPLWPDGVPEGWSADDAGPAFTAMKLEFAVPAGLSATESAELNQRIAAFMAELSAMHVAMGGNGLRILDHDSVETIPVEDEAPLDCAPSVTGGAR